MLLITDTGPLTHASQTGHVGFLERILAPWTCAYPMQVRTELEGFDGNRAILEAKWIELLPLDLKYDILAMELREGRKLRFTPTTKTAISLPSTTAQRRGLRPNFSGGLSVNTAAL